MSELKVKVLRRLYDSLLNPKTVSIMYNMGIIAITPMGENLIIQTLIYFGSCHSLKRGNQRGTF